jgi:hypothetical protein
MKRFISSLIAAALFAFSATTAGALVLELGGPAGQPVANGDQIQVTVSIDAEGVLDIVTLSVGILFDDTQLSYNQTASSTTSYVLYNTVVNPKTGATTPGTYLNAASSCGGSYYSPNATEGCAIRIGTTDQVNADYISTGFPTGGTTGGTTDLLVTLVFDVIAAEGLPDSASPVVRLSLTSPGNVIGDSSGDPIAATVIGEATVAEGVLTVPEPAIAGLSLVAILTVAGLRTQARRRR